MKLNFKNLPTGNLPYEDINLCKQMMLKLYEHVPYIPELPLLDSNDTIVSKTFRNAPGISVKEKKFLILDNSTSAFSKVLAELEKSYNLINMSDLDAYSGESPFFNMYTEMLKRIKPQYTVVRLLGPFSFADVIFNQNTANLLSDKLYRKYIVQLITLKAFWYINKIKEISPETHPIIMFDEPYLYKFGTLKRMNDSITKESIEGFFSKIFSKIQKAGAFVGVQSFEKCNWQLLFDSGVNLISFDAYNNPESLYIIADKVNDFLARGGYINWGIIPVTNETLVRGLNIEKIYEKFIKATEGLNAAGASLDAIYRNCTVSIQGNLANLPILFAEKALIIENQLAKKIPLSSKK